MIKNLKQCVNLKYFYSHRNEYSEDDIKDLKRLTTFISEDDTYKSTNHCMVECLFK